MWYRRSPRVDGAPIDSAHDPSSTEPPLSSSEVPAAEPKALAPPPPATLFETAKVFYNREKNKSKTELITDEKTLVTEEDASPFEWQNEHLVLWTEVKSDARKKPSWQAVATRIGCTVQQAKHTWQDLLRHMALVYATARRSAESDDRSRERSEPVADPQDRAKMAPTRNPRSSFFEAAAEFLRVVTQSQLIVGVVQKLHCGPYLRQWPVSKD